MNSLISETYEIEIYNTETIKEMDYIDLENHYDMIMQDCTEILEYLKNIRHRLIIYNKLEEDNEHRR